MTPCNPGVTGRPVTPQSKGPCYFWVTGRRLTHGLQNVLLLLGYRTPCNPGVTGRCVTGVLQVILRVPVPLFLGDRDKIVMANRNCPQFTITICLLMCI